MRSQRLSIRVADQRRAVRHIVRCTFELRVYQEREPRLKRETVGLVYRSTLGLDCTSQETRRCQHRAGYLAHVAYLSIDPNLYEHVAKVPYVGRALSGPAPAGLISPARHLNFATRPNEGKSV